MLQKIADVIRDGRKFLITSHVRPDGDSIGAALALYHILVGMGKSAVVCHQDETPYNYRFLPGSERIVHDLPSMEDFDAAFVLDCSELDRVGDLAASLSAIRTLINIDHHISNRRFCELAYIDEHASSTSELIFRLARQMQAKLNKDAANNLYAGILTDTGGFRYSNTGEASLQAAAGLVACGADPQWISENVYEKNPLSKIRLLALTLETLAIDMDGRVGSLVITQNTLDQAGATMEQSEGFVDIPRTIDGVVVSILYSEMKDQFFKVSLRSKERFNVAGIAEKFGGGGHINAAACRYRGDIAQVKQAVGAAVRELF
jgi:bifunctional oligoribonuclease and PAP phosphatase NrnA